MSKHTPTPWLSDLDNWLSVIDGAASNPIDRIICQVNGKIRPEADQNRARIVACVNAFHSEDGREISTEKIEPGLFWEMRDLISDLMEHEDPGWGEKDYDRAAALLAKLED